MKTHFQEIRFVIASLPRLGQNKGEGEASVCRGLNCARLLNVDSFLIRRITVSFSMNIFVVSVSYVGISIYVVATSYLRLRPNVLIKNKLWITI
jgi:hypothetical protein